MTVLGGWRRHPRPLPAGGGGAPSTQAQGVIGATWPCRHRTHPAGRRAVIAKLEGALGRIFRDLGKIRC
jgi:hypothetical protein